MILYLCGHALNRAVFTVNSSVAYKQLNNRPRPNYMQRQSDITSNMRTILVDWLVEVAEEYHLHRETLFLAVNFIDRFLSVMAVQRSKLQLVGTAAMFIAAYVCLCFCTSVWMLTL